jgi:hypothetical protein
MNFKYILKVLLIILIIFSVIILINLICLNLNSNIQPKKILNLEALEPLIMKSSDAFCKTHTGFDLEKSCNKLTKYNCGETTCCEWSTKCKAKNKNGIIFS